MSQAHVRTPDARDAFPVDDLRSLLQQGHLDEARGLLETLRARFAPHPDLDRWARILSPPRAHVGGEGRTSGQVAENAAWLRENDERYFGQWVALHEGTLLGASPDYLTLHRELERRGALAGARFFRLMPG